MERIKEFFCWIKLSPPTDGKDEVASDWQAAVQALLDTARSGKASPADIEFLVQTIRNGPRPPRARNGPRPPGVYGGSLMSGWWQLDSIWVGNPSSNLVVGYAPVPGNRDDAIAWLETPDGHKWLVGSVTYFLMSFGAVVDL